MKRAAPDVEFSSKRSKTDPDSVFDDPNLQRDVKDIIECTTEATGYIACRSYMAWKPMNKKHRAILEMTTDSSQIDRFEVEFVGACADFFSEIEVKALDEFLLALNGSKIERLSESSRVASLPIKLRFTDGVIMKFLKRRGGHVGRDGGCIVNTWKLKEAAKKAEDDWFLTPRPVANVYNDKEIQATASTAPEIPRAPPQISSPPTHADPTLANSISAIPAKNSSSYFPPPPPILKSATPEPELPDHIPKAKHDVTEVPTISSRLDSISAQRDHHAAVPKQLSKKEKKRIAKEERKRQGNKNGDPNPSVPADTLRQKESPTRAIESTTVTPHANSTSMPLHDTITPSDNTETLPEKRQLAPAVAQQGPLNLRAGVFADSDNYQALNKLASGAISHIVGIVVSVSTPSITRHGDWMCNVKLVDPSNTELDNLSGREGFQINIFVKEYRERLPQPSMGEVLILRNVKITEYHGCVMGVGYHGKLQWAIFSSASGKVRHGDLGNMPESEGLADGYGYNFSSLFRPGEEVIRYCLKISDWWSEVLKQREEVGQVHQVAGQAVSCYASYERPRRVHRLISEANPDLPPSGFFDCTVEVLHGYNNDNGVYSLYVTDYTRNTAVTPIQAEWCPVQLADLVLKFEVWDGAVDLAQAMLAGECYSIKNARMRLSMGGYLEGKIAEPKIERMEEWDAGVNPYYQALLARKAAWKEANGDETANVFEYRTIGEAAEGEHFNCVVEVLHSIYDGNGTSCLYVTDYTSRKELLSLTESGSWSAGHEGQILKISLWDSQVEKAKFVVAGSFYTIKKLRLKTSTTGRHFQGRLGGMESLVLLRRTDNNDDEMLQALKKRKDEWKATFAVQTKAETPDRPVVRRRHGKTISEVKASEKCPNKFRIFAAVADFRPRDLRDAVIIHCTNCEQDLPSTQKACFKCDDTDHEYVRYMYQMYFLLQDDDDQIYVSVNDECPIFEGLKRADIRDDANAYAALSKRLDPMLGNLTAVHTSSSPVWSLIIDSWEVDGKRAYCLAGCEDLTG
ncbi:hypothetical protein Hypma_011802 [Hypsizygus marmoreus]|uniref:Protection of telomeres protein 1 n=1 Tax=Hypsizygus marmoreus TaxID=39966 RepID=A0A369JHQ7_HYPMA|nr:hypothetical protein Hypma_011802 [Hypsizygus marmoreus]